MTTTSVVVRPRRTRSNSQLNDYLHCGYSFYLKRIAGVQERPSVWLAGGRAFHTTTEDYDQATADERERIVWTDRFLEHFATECDALREREPDMTRWRTAGRKTKDKPNGEDASWWAAEGQTMITKYIEWRISTADVLDIAPVEGAAGIEVEVTDVLGAPVVGFVDRLMRWSNGTLLVVDLKTGSRTPDSPLQLALYSVILERKLRAPVSWGAYYDARKGVLTEPIDLTGFDREKLSDIYRQLDNGVEAGIFLPNITSMCKACAVKDACKFQGGALPTPAIPEAA